MTHNHFEREYHQARAEVLRGAVVYYSYMEYTHHENIEWDAITTSAYNRAFSVGRLPTRADALMRRAKKMILTGFVKHRAFDDCFEMGNGAEVMGGLVAEATINPVLRREIIRCETFIGNWDDLVAHYQAPSSLGGLFEATATLEGGRHVS